MWGHQWKQERRLGGCSIRQETVNEGGLGPR